MKWAVTIAVVSIDESAVGLLISNLPPETAAVLVGREEMRLSLVKFKVEGSSDVEASSDAEARALGLEIFNKAAASAGLSLQPEVRSVEMLS